MHAFQPYPIKEIEFNPFVRFGEKWGALTTKADDKINTMTISWGGVGVIWDKPVATVYVRESRFTKELLDKSETFSVTFFEDKFQRTLKYLGQVSGRDEDKLKNARLTINEHQGIPFIDEGNFIVVCKKLYSLPLTLDDVFDKDVEGKYYTTKDLHTMYLGEIVELLAR